MSGVITEAVVYRNVTVTIWDFLAMAFMGLISPRVQIILRL